jgi:DNA-directed RNA polymerase subunit RPC12/RpoP
MHPIYIIIIIVAAYAVIMILFTLSRGANSHFICPKCGYDFQVKGIKYLLSPKTFVSHYVTCPKCGYRAFMKVLPGKK